MSSYILRKPKIVETRQFRNLSRRAFESALNQAFVGCDVYHHYDPNEIWNVRKSTSVLSLADKHVLLRQRKVRSNYNPWITADIKYFGHRRDFLKQKAVTHIIYATAYLQSVFTLK